MTDQLDSAFFQDSQSISQELTSSEAMEHDDQEELPSIIEQVKIARGESTWTATDIELLKAGALIEIKYYLKSIKKKLTDPTNEDSQNLNQDSIRRHRKFMKSLTSETKDAIALEIMKGSSIDEAFAQCSDIFNIGHAEPDTSLLPGQANGQD